MANRMQIRLSDAPVDDLVRVHAERSDWDAPNVRYLRRGANGRAPSPPPRAADDDTVVFEFAAVEVRIRATGDHIEVHLRRLPPRLALAA